MTGVQTCALPIYTSEVQVKLVDGVIVERASELQNWVTEVISINERLQNKRIKK